MVFKGLGYAAALAVLGLVSATNAGSTQQAQAGDSAAPPLQYPLNLDDTTAPAAAPRPPPVPLGPPPTPIMFLIGNTGVGQWMNNNHLSITGIR